MSGPFLDSLLASLGLETLWPLTGTVSPSDKELMIQQETADLIKAGMSPAQAQAQAEHDITAALVSDNADPSQASAGNAVETAYDYYTTGNPMTAPKPAVSIFLTIALIVGGAFVIGKAIE